MEPITSEDKRILVVDDNSAICDMLTEVLEDEGYQVMSASNGQEALSVLQKAPQPPALILLDLMMPVMSGWQFRAAQQHDPSLSAIPTVVISASANLEPAAALNADGYLAKPINYNNLMQLVERYCS
jgi:CheY-like chemotaxis protein